jgi:membrane protein
MPSLSLSLKRLLLRPLRILAESVISFLAHSDFVLASSISFYMLLAVVPFILFGLSIFGAILTDVNVLQSIYDLLGKLFVNEQTLIWFKAILNRIIADQGITTFWGIATLLFTATGMFRSLEYAVNKIYEAKLRPFWSSYLYSMSLSLILNVLLLFGILASPIIGYAAVTQSPLVNTIIQDVPVVAIIIQNIFSWFIFGVICLLIYLIMPNAKKRFRDAFWGAVSAALLWNLLKWGFTVYLEYFSTFKIIYGALGTVLGAVIWIYLSVAIILFGAEISFTLSKRSRGQLAPSFLRIGWLAAKKLGVKVLGEIPAIRRAGGVSEQKPDVPSPS